MNRLFWPVLLLASSCAQDVTQPTHPSAVGILDETFGDGGTSVLQFGNGSSALYAVALQPDGRIVAVGYATIASYYQFLITRFHPDGSLDASFDGDGGATTAVNPADGYDFAYDVAIQPDGKIVVAGTDQHTYRMAVVRYNADGSLDSSFDGDGILTSDIIRFATALMIHPTGKILVAGLGAGGGRVVRLNPDGSLDITFGNGGVAATTMSWVDAMVVQSNGRIVVAGSGSVVRYHADGSLDASFAGGAIPIQSSSLYGSYGDLTLQSDGKILVGGQKDGVCALARLNPDGTPDASFEGDGVIVLSTGFSPSHASGVAVQSDGKILLTGVAYRGATAESFLARYATDGSMDPTFGNSGIVECTGLAYDLVSRSDGRILVCGTSSFVSMIAQYR